MGLAAFAVWFVLFAPTLQHNAQVSPVGHRRTISLDLVGPVAAFSRVTQLSRIVSATGREDRSRAAPPASPSRARRPTGRRQDRSPSRGPAASTTTTVPVNPKEPTAADPLRVLIVGDSLGLDMGGALQDDLAGTGVVNAALDAPREHRPDPARLLQLAGRAGQPTSRRCRPRWS